MESIRKRSLINFILWLFASAALYALAYIAHLAVARLAAFVALSLSVITFVLAFRAGTSKTKLRLQANISGGATILAAILYLIQSGWRP